MKFTGFVNTCIAMTKISTENNYSMIKKITISFILLIVSLANVLSTPVTEETARQAAASFLSHYSRLKSNRIELGNPTANQYQSLTTFYSFNVQNGGWILISADNVATPVLAYSDQGSFAEDQINPNAKYWLQQYSREIYDAVQKNAANEASAKEWDNLLNQNFSDVVTTVAPLLKTNWDQSAYYNEMCPASAKAPSGYGGHVPTGCVATTMAQILKYYAFPAQGVGAHSYTHPVYNTLSANYGSTDYNWTNMPNSVTSSNSAVANLMFQCGVAVEMDYEPNGSGAQSSDVPYALTTYFNYDPGVTYVSMSSVSSLEIWRTLIRNELDSLRPVYYGGQEADGGHAWVCDGYDGSNPTRFHMNWGWGGSLNGYFAIGALNPGSNSFNDYNHIIIGIKPRKNPNLICRINKPAYGDAFNPGTPVSLETSVVKGVPSKVYLYVDNIKTDSLSAAPFNFSIPTGGWGVGPHYLSIVATDGSNTDSHEIPVILNSSCWQKVNVPFTTDSVNVEQISVVDNQVVWATLRDYSSKAASLRQFIKSTDGGTNWVLDTINCTSCSGLDISNIFAMSATKAYACLNPGNSSGGLIVVTNDGGNTWTPQTTASFVRSWADWVYFFDANNGVCMGDSYNNKFFIYTTSDGGTNWVRVPSTSVPDALASEAGIVNFYDVSGNTIWFGTDNGRIYKSTDKGLNWTVKSNVLGAVQTNVRFKDANTGFAFGSSGTIPFKIMKTTDGGTNWNEIIPDGAVSGQDFEFIPGTSSSWINTGLLSSLSFNDNTYFYWLDYNTLLRTVKFISPGIGWGGGYYSKKNGGGMYKWVGSVAPTYSAPITFKVTDAGKNAIADASINFNAQTKTTDTGGKVTFDVTGMGNPETYQVSKTGYTSVYANYNVSQKDTIKITLNASYSVTFQVVNASNTPVDGATVIFNGKTATTSADGTATFTNINDGYSYPYAVTKTKFYAGYGQIKLSGANKTVTVSLVTDRTAIPIASASQSVVFPVPATSVLNILNENPIMKVRIMTLGGHVLYNQTQSSNTVQLSVEGISPGEYILEVKTGKGVGTQKITIAR